MFEFTVEELLRLSMTFVASVSHIFTALLGFQVSRYYQPARNMFTFAMILLSWSTLMLGLTFGGLGKYYPYLLYLSPMFSGFILPAFYIYLRTVINPHVKTSLGWFIFGLPGFIYGINGLILDEGKRFALSYILEEKTIHTFHPILHILFTSHSIGMIGLSFGCMVITFKAYFTTNDQDHKNTLSWLLAVIVVSWVILLATNVLPLLGLTHYTPFLPLLTILISTLSYRALRGLVATVGREKEFKKEIQIAKMESLGRMARGIAHDINNMLSGIIGHTELAEIHQDNKVKLQHHLEQVKTIGLRAGSLHHTLLTFSGKGNKRVTEAVDISLPIREAVGIVEPQLNPDIQLLVKISQQLPLVSVSTSGLHRAVLNLLLNSIEAMNGRQGTIELSIVYEETAVIPISAIGRELDGNEAIYIEIRDAGIGMSDEVAKKILDPFFSTKKTGEGMGLVNVLSMVRESNAALNYSSVEGEGSIFQVWLPVIKPLPSTNVQELKKTSIKQRILVVDDDEMVLETLKELLESLDVETIIATSGRKAIEICETNSTIDKVLLDIRMEGMDGIETARILQEKGITLPIVFMSGDASLNQSQDQYFLRKPIALSSLKEFIDHDLV
jgi:signal transduction histidine kinase